MFAIRFLVVEYSVTSMGVTHALKDIVFQIVNVLIQIIIVFKLTEQNASNASLTISLISMVSVRHTPFTVYLCVKEFVNYASRNSS